MPRDKVFISYSHEDREWLEKLQTMLEPLVRKNSVLCMGRFEDREWREVEARN